MNYDWRKKFRQRATINRRSSRPVFLTAPEVIKLLQYESRRVPHDAALQLLAFAQEVIIVVQAEPSNGSLFRLSVPSSSATQEKLMQAMDQMYHYGPGEMFRVFVHNAISHSWLKPLTPLELLTFLEC